MTTFLFILSPIGRLWSNLTLKYIKIWPIRADLKVPMSHYQVLASPSHLEGPYFSMKTSGNHMWWHLWAKKWPRFNGEKSPKMKLNFKVGVFYRNFAFFGLKPNDIKQRSWFWPKIPISDVLTQLDWRHLENQNKSKKCTFLLENIQVNGPEIF